MTRTQILWVVLIAALVLAMIFPDQFLRLVRAFGFAAVPRAVWEFTAD